MLKELFDKNKNILLRQRKNVCWRYAKRLLP